MPTFLLTWPTLLMRGCLLTLLLCLQHPLHHRHQPCVLQARMLSGRTTMGPKSCFYLFSFLQTQQNNQATLPKQKKDPSPPWETQQAHFLGTSSTTSAAQLFSASLQRRACRHLFAFWAGGHHLFPRNWLPSKVPALRSTFLQKTALQVHNVHLHQAPPAAIPQPPSTNHSHIHFLVCSH